MPGTRLSMRKVREVLGLKHALGMSERLIAEAVGAGKSAVGEYIRRARVIGLTWPVPDGLDDAELERRLFSPPGFHVGPTKPQPHWPTIQEELKGRGVTLLLLWEEYRAEHADGYGYSRFCDLYVEWRKRITPTMRQTHVAGEKLFVDWAGDTIPVFDAITGAEHGARIFVVLPTRVRKPRDKAKVEVAVQIVERFVLAKLRKRRFFSLDELNAAIRECVAAINTKVMRAFGKSRRELLDAVERPALRGLPVEPYQYAEWKRCGVAPDYHVEIGDHYYSVPFRLLRETVDARLTDTTVEVFHKGLRVASHPRSSVHNRHTTTPEHMPSSHRRYATWTPQRMVNEAAKIGPATIALVEAIMKAKPHPEQGFRSCLGIMRLVRTYGIARVEAASRRGNDIGATTYGSIASILKTGLDRAYANSKAPDGPPIRHANIRGRGYYH